MLMLICLRFRAINYLFLVSFISAVPTWRAKPTLHYSTNFLGSFA